MANENTAAPAKKKRAAFTRTAKPVFALVSYTDGEGNQVALNAANLTIKLERDAAAILDAVTGGTFVGVAKQVALPVAEKKPAVAA